jgi:hypothetical protein
MIDLDIHDRVNYSVTRSALRVVGPHAAREMTGERGGNGEPSGNPGPAEGVRSSDGGETVRVTTRDVAEKNRAGTRSEITLALRIDTSISPVMEYFEIFLPRMLLSNRAAEKLGATYQLVINETHIL